MQEPRELVKLKTSPVGDGDRLSFAIIIAISFHLLIMLGITFVLPKSQEGKIPLSLDVTLAHRESIEAPENADFIGQNNQVGAGDSEQANRPTTELEHFRTTEGETTTPSLEIPPEAAQTNQQLELVTSKNSQVPIKTAPNDEIDPNVELQQKQITEISPPPKTLRQFNVEQGNEQQLLTRGTKKRQISASVMASPDDAPYLEAWRNKVLQVGNQHYSTQATKLGFGSPIIKASIDKSGRLISVTLQKASGNKLIDEMALELVRLAAPFDPFPESMRKDTDVLEIIRLLRFHPNKGLSSK